MDGRGRPAVGVRSDSGSGGDSMIDSRIHRVATCGNAVALTALVLLLSQADVLFEDEKPLRDDLGGRATSAGVVASSVVVVVIDGLRLDAARDADLMPNLHRLSGQGQTSVAWVQSMVPSSLAGIVALSTGRVSPPGKFLFDFYAPSADHGGIFETLGRHGGKSFVAGPTLWSDLYGQWITKSELDPTYGSADAALLRGAIRSLRGDRYRLVVIHFGQTDASAHQHGTDSAEYREAVVWCDQAIAKIHREMRRSDCLVVTSDHGNTRRGGHAGPEFDVMATPLVVVSPAGDLELPPDIPQTAIAGLLVDLLGLGARTEATPKGPARAFWRSWGTGALACFAIMCGLRICGTATGRADSRRFAFLLNSTFWIAAVLAVVGWIFAALVLALTVLAGAAWAAGVEGVGKVVGRGGLVLMSGVAIGVLRLCDGGVALTAGSVHGIGAVCGLLSMFGIFSAATLDPRGLATPAPTATRDLLSGELGRLGAIATGGAIAYAVGHGLLLAAFLAAVAVGLAFARLLAVDAPHGAVAESSHARLGRICVAGALVPVFQVLLSRFLGETVSLSTIDVRVAYDVVDLPAGLALAAVVTIASQAIPTAGLLIGSSHGLARLSGPQMGMFCAGASMIVVGQLSSGLLTLALADRQFLGFPHVPLESLAVGTIVRSLAEATYLFMGIAIVLLTFAGSRSGHRPEHNVRDESKQAVLR